MSEIYIEAEGPCTCGNCGWSGDAADLESVKDAEQRLAAGETVPAGECPECGSLAYLDNPPDYTADAQADKYKGQRDELLAALKDLLRDMETPRSRKATVSWDRARAVVAKAEGK